MASIPYDDEQLDALRATGDPRLFATIDALREKLGYKRCANCKALRPPMGTKDRYGREAGFYNVNGYPDKYCAPCRRAAANERYANLPYSMRSRYR